MSQAATASRITETVMNRLTNDPEFRRLLSKHENVGLQNASYPFLKMGDRIACGKCNLLKDSTQFSEESLKKMTYNSPTCIECCC